ncbi:hypothetical protein [Thermococcus sp.]|uniref:hypothetical protein n=1 Tax=Thermococcus sp. TaxID=35749 RepID=UPI00260EFFFF|nr:hypothetical protein [Thermococcus sp.]
MKKTIYLTSVVLTAIFLFWPVLYGNIGALQKLPGNPVLQATVGVLLFGALAYLTYEGGEEAKEEEFTAS